MNDEAPAQNRSSDSVSNSSSGGGLLEWISTHRWLLIGCVVAVALLPTQAEQLDTPEMTERRVAIERMTQTERSLLEHNAGEYGQLNQAARKEVAELHNAVESNPELDQTLSEFHQWLGTLTFEERDAVLLATDPRERLAMVRELRTRQRSVPAWPQSGGPGGRDFPPELRQSIPWLRQPPRQEDVKRMFDVIAGWLQLRRPPRSNDPNRQTVFHLEVVIRLLDRISPNWTGQGAGPDGPFRDRPVIPDDLRRDLLSILDDEELSRLLNDRPEPQQNMVLLGFIMRGLMFELAEMRRHSPNAQELASFFLKLPDNVRNDLNRWQGDERIARLRLYWLATQLPDDLRDRAPTLFPALERLTSRTGPQQPEPPGGRRPQQ